MENQTENKNDTTEKPVNPYYTPEEEAKHREEVRKRFSGTNYLRNVAIMGIISVVVGSGGLMTKVLAGTSAEEYMEAKYQKDFVEVGAYDDNERYYIKMTPKGEPETLIRVEVRGGMPWNTTYVDDYYMVEASKNVEKKVKELAKSQYAKKIFCKGKVSAYLMGAQWVAVERKYTLAQVKLGIREAPEAYRNAGMKIVFLGNSENQEMMIQEMHGIYQQLASEFPTMPFVELTVGDINKYLTDERVRDTCNDLRLEEVGGTEITNGKFFWFIESQQSIDMKRALTDYTYFKNITRELYPTLWETKEE